MTDYKKAHASLFSGGGGFDLASEWMGWENAFNCEINPFCRKILNYYWPNTESYEDITRTDFTVWRNKIDVLSGGFPCQGFSIAGLRAGTEDHRFLWPEMRRAYNECKPPWVVCENVTGLLTMADEREVSKDVFFKVENSQVVRLQEVDMYSAIYIQQEKMLIESICHDLEEDGYDVQTFNIPAAGVEAPHRRERVWIVAYSDSNGWQRNKKHEEGQQYDGRGPARRKPESFDGPGSTTNPNSERLPQRIQRGERGNEKQAETSKGSEFTRTYTENKWKEFPTQPPVHCRNDGLSGRLDGITFSKHRTESIKMYGNAVVPDIPYEFFKIIDQI